jgi:hypothetical protein
MAFTGNGEVAVFTDEIFPLEIIYTVQNGGAPFDTRLGTSVVLNLLSLIAFIKIGLCYVPTQ